MKAKFDQIICGKKVISGFTTKVEGRIRGSSRSRKLVYVWGKQGQQDRLRRIQYHSTALNTRYGTLGIKVQIAVTREGFDKQARIFLKNDHKFHLNDRFIELLQEKRQIYLNNKKKEAKSSNLI